MSKLRTQIRRELREAGAIIRTLVVASATDEFMLEGKGQPRRRPAGIDNSKIRILSGRLARSIAGKPYANRNETRNLVRVGRDGQYLHVVVGSNVPYAAIHEFGGSGVNTVSAHERRMTHVFGRVLDEPRTVQVKAHSRKYSVPKRPYLAPAVDQNAKQIIQALAKSQQRILDLMAHEQSNKQT